MTRGRGLIPCVCGMLLITGCTAPASTLSDQNPTPTAGTTSDPPSPDPSSTAVPRRDPAVDLHRGVPAQGPRLPGSAGKRAAADFNHDGYPDLAIGMRTPAPRADGDTRGLVHVLYGTPTGFEAAVSQQWSRADVDPTAPGRADGFGAALGHGDFDGDGSSDLAVGDPARTSGGDGAGAVTVWYGGATGLSATRTQRWSLDAAGVAGRAKKGDVFGNAVAAGDLGRSHHDDLAIGIPGRDRGRGAVLVLFGGDRGLSATDAQTWDEETLGGQATRDDGFGDVLAAGDFAGDDHDELVIGATYDEVEGAAGAGSVYVLRGTDEGPSARRAQHWSPGRNGLRGAPAPTDLFGRSLAVGHFDADDHLDLAVGSPGWSSPDGGGGAGAVSVLYGSRDGLTANRNQRWTEYDLGTRELAELGDPPADSPRFGTALAAADFGRGSPDDLVIGIPERSSPGLLSGAVQILYGTSSGLRKRRAEQLSQATRGMRGGQPEEAGFGEALAVLPSARSGSYPTLVAAAPRYLGADGGRTGAIHLITGSARGLSAAGNQLWTADQLPRRPKGEGFGWPLSS